MAVPQKLAKKEIILCQYVVFVLFVNEPAVNNEVCMERPLTSVELGFC